MPIHATVLLASYLAFSLAVFSGVAFLVQERRLKRKDPALLRAPTLPLEVLDRLNWLGVVVGFILFSFGMIQGYLLARREWGAYFTGDPIEIWAELTWAAYAAVLALRLTVGLKGRRVVWLSVASFGLVLFTVVGVQFFIGTRHMIF